MSSVGNIYLDTELAFSQIGDLDAMNGMLQMLHDTLSRDVPRITQLLQEGDIASANPLLHSLKGFIPIFCIASLCNEVAQVEAMSKDSQSLTVVPAYTDLLPRLLVLQTEVSQHVQRQSQLG